MADAPTPPVQLDDATAAKLGRIFAGLAHNPKGRPLVAKAVREVMPDSPEARSFADIDQQDRFESFRAELEAKELKKQQDEIVARLNQQRLNLLTGGPGGEGRKYSEDDVKNIEALMQKKGIVDYEDGATLYASTLPPEVHNPHDMPPPENATTWEFPEWARFGHDPAKASREVANEVIAEFKRKRR